MDQEMRLVVKAEGQGPPVEIRLKRLLKTALRACGLRCVTVEVVDVDQKGKPHESHRSHT